MHSQPFLDAVLGINPIHPSRQAHERQMTGGSFGVLPISPNPSCSSTLHDIDLLRFGGPSSFAHGVRSHQYSDTSSLPVDLTDYEMMQLLAPVASPRSTCRCGGSESQPSYQIPQGPSMSAGLGTQRPHYPPYAQSPMEHTPLSHYNPTLQNLYNPSPASSKPKTSPNDIPYFPSEYPSNPNVHYDGLDSWEAMNAELLSSMSQLIPSADLPNFLPPSPYYETSPDTSPSPSASPKSANSEYFNNNFETSDDIRRPQPPSPQQPPVKQCSHCRATSTPLWRREPTTLKPLCNACGLYLQQRNKLRPQELIDADDDDDAPSDSPGDMSGPECSHCHTRQTSVWRRSKTGAQLCNACGVYSRLRGKDRPLSLKRNKIKPRSKHPSAK